MSDLTASYDWSLPRSARAAATARSLVSKALLDAGLAALVDDLRLIVSELVTNALRHGRSGPANDEDDRIGLRLAVGPGRVRLEVEDAGAGLPRFPPSSRGPSSTDENGRGLHMVRHLAARCGFILCEDRPGKVVFAEVHISQG